MKKVIITLISLSLLILCLLSFASCSKKVDEISNIKLDTDTLTISWDRVIGAKNYTVTVSGSELEKTTKDNKYSLEYLEPGTYEVLIKANGDGFDYEDSDWVSYSFVREAESGMRFKLINNKTEYELTGLGSASGDIVMPSTYRGKPVTSIGEKAFAGNNRVTSFVVGDKVTKIGNSAFSRCSELTSITIPNSVTTIGERCFQSCKKLESFTFPSSVTKVSPYVFSWCSALKSVTMSDGVEVIGAYAFSSCAVLEEINFSSTLTLIEEYAFSDCLEIISVTLGDKVETIQPFAFYNCISLTELEIGNSLKLIDESAFSNCKSLTAVALPDSCETIGIQAFRYCQSLESVSFGASMQSVGAGAFNNTKLYEDADTHVIISGWYIACKDRNIVNYTMPTDVYAIADRAFYTCKKLAGVQFPYIKYVGSNAFYGCEALQMALFGNELLYINEYAFKNCKALKQVGFGNSLISIGDYAFSGCTALSQEKTTLPMSLTSIGAGAFKGVKTTNENGVSYFGRWAVGLASAQTIPDKVVIKSGTIGIANYAFSDVMIFQTSVNTYGIDIADSVMYIGRGAFYKAAASGYPVTVKLPQNLRVIGDYAFYGDYCALFNGADRHLVIPESTEYIGRSAFYGCESIYSLTVSASVKEIAPYAFYQCVNLGAKFESEDGSVTVDGALTFLVSTDVIVDEETGNETTVINGVTTIGDKAFYKCSGLRALELPSTLTNLGSRVFYKCEGLKTLTLGEGLTYIPDSSFYGCISLEDVSIPDSVTHIGNYAFRGCSALRTIELGNGVNTIGNFAFFGAETVQSLVIPESVTSIGTHAFRGMSRVKSIIIPAGVESILAHAFYGAVNAVIYVDGEIPEGWNVRWNSSFAPVFTSCTLSDEGDYAVSFVKGENNPDNLSTSDGVIIPQRPGYELSGFATSASGEAAYTVEELSSAKAGEVLYFVWTPKTT